MYLQEYEVTDPIEGYHMLTVCQESLGTKWILIETALFKELYNAVEKSEGQGSLIVGPKGTGKSTCSAYLSYKAEGFEYSIPYY